MRTLGTLNGDVLTVIFQFVDKVDLPSVVLVNRAFQESATPLLYRTIWYTNNNCVKTPFVSLEENVALASHVQNFVLEASLGQRPPDPGRLEECRRILERCKGLRRFQLNAGYPAPFIHAVLQVLLSKASLQDIELACGSAISKHDDIDTLVSLRRLRRVALEDPSWQLINKLPEWTASLTRSLRVFEITSSDCFNSEILEDVLVNLSDITDLKILSCSKVRHDDVLGMVRHIPFLEEMSLSIWLEPNTSPPQYIGSVGNLKGLTLDMKNAIDKTRCTPFWKAFLTSIKKSGSELTGLTLQTLRKVIIGTPFINHIRRCHGDSLTSLELRNVVVSPKVAGAICANLYMLEELTLTIPNSSIMLFAEAFSLSSSLRSIRNIVDKSSPSQTTLSNLHVREIAKEALSITNIECQGRRWTIMRKVDNLTDFAILYTARGARGARHI